MSRDLVSPVSVGEIVAGKYRIDRVIGAGGMGIVVVATHLTIEQRVAIKFLRAGAHPKAGDYAARFLREARAAAKLRSEHVARVFDAAQLPDGTPYIVMEFLEGSDLAEVIERDPQLPVADCVEYILQACEALIEAHACGIVHRDLKPQNLFVTRKQSGLPLLKILDFGIAKEIGGGSGDMKILTDSSVVLGSPLYMAPEQMRGAKNIDVRTDIWSLGVVLHQMLAGALPFDADTVPELCVKVLTEEPLKLTAVAQRVPPELSLIVERCLRKAPEERFRNVAELALALEPYSRSGERGIQDRPWRSLVDTVDSDRDISADSGPNGTAFVNALGSGSHAPQVTISPGLSRHVSRVPNRGTSKAATDGVSWGELRVEPAGPPSRVKRRRSFAFGMALGVVVSALVVVVAIAARMPRSSAGASNTAAGPWSAPLETSPVQIVDLPYVALSASSAGSAAPTHPSTGSTTGASVRSTAPKASASSTAPGSSGSSESSGHSRPTGAPSRASGATSPTASPTASPTHGTNDSPILAPP